MGYFGMVGKGLVEMAGGLKSDYEVLTSPGDRVYYYNKRTKESSFEKPDVLKGPGEDFDVDPWVECRSRRGRVFYHNTVTGESKWERPPKRKEDRTLIKGVGVGMRITDYETSKYLVGRLMEQYGITSMRDVFYKLSTEPIFRAIRVEVRERLARKYLEDKDREAKEEEIRNQKYYVEEVCKIRVDVADFFGFNSVFSKHPYYSRIKDRFGCYEAYVEKHAGGTATGKLEEIFRSIGVGLDSSAKDILGMKEMEPFDKKVVLFSFSRYFHRLEKEFLERVEKRREAWALDVQRSKKTFRRLLEKLYSEGLIYYRMKFKSAFHLFKDSDSFLNLLGAAESPKEIYFDFINDLEKRLKRYGQDGLGKADPVDRRAMERYLESVAEDKEEGEI